MIRYYPALVERAIDGFGVTFPDLPGCTSHGATVQEAARNAEVALRGHLEVSIEHGDAIPEPSDLPPAHPEMEVVSRLLVRADVTSAGVGGDVR